MQRLLEIGTALVPWVTLAGLVIHCLVDKEKFARLFRSRVEK